MLSRASRRAVRRFPYGMRPGTTLVDGRQVHWLTTGNVAGMPAVLFLPGLGAPGYLAPWARETARWTRATIVELPAWRDPSGDSVPTLAGVTTAAVRYLEETGSENVILLGHSTGAQVAARVALRIPDRIAGVVLAGPTFDPAARTFVAVCRRALRNLVREVPGEVPAVLPFLLRSKGIPLLRFVRSALPDRLEEQVRKLECPVLVVTGKHDRFAPPVWARELAAPIGAKCVILPGAHNGCFPHPQQADAALREAALEWLSAANSG
jgi:pimeloyl-ACP methyl ester carboxylesterase